VGGPGSSPRIPSSNRRWPQTWRKSAARPKAVRRTRTGTWIAPGTSQWIRRPRADSDTGGCSGSLRRAPIRRTQGAGLRKRRPRGSTVKHHAAEPRGFSANERRIDHADRLRNGNRVQRPGRARCLFRFFNIDRSTRTRGRNALYEPQIGASRCGERPLTLPFSHRNEARVLSSGLSFPSPILVGERLCFFSRVKWLRLRGSSAFCF